ncbi:2093_t:CDS:2 [Paraglomus occultum]|uniref:2093_t:CDS:1 n=1 Tax=Paraglomus occultum TaxID=144539 RepID=A0A9N9C0V9_9GLOM|nr:2093_t:CDS:2 [Paraglomus occultum]
MSIRRTNIKKATKQLWKDKFKQQCMDRIKESRMKAFNAKRGGFIMTDESENEVVFQAAYEKDYASSVGDVDIDMAALLEEEFLQEISRDTSSDEVERMLANEEEELWVRFEEFQKYYDDENSSI